MKRNTPSTHRHSPDIGLEAAMRAARSYLKTLVDLPLESGPQDLFCLLLENGSLFEVRQLLPYVDLDSQVAVESSLSLSLLVDQWRMLEENVELQTGGRVRLALPRPASLSRLAHYVTSRIDGCAQDANLVSWDSFLAKRDWCGADPASGVDENGAPIGILEMEIFRCWGANHVEHILDSPLVTNSELPHQFLDRVEARIAFVDIDVAADASYNAKDLVGLHEIHGFLASLMGLSIALGRPNPALWSAIHERVCSCAERPKTSLLLSYVGQINKFDTLVGELDVIDSLCDGDLDAYNAVLHEGARFRCQDLVSFALHHGADPSSELDGRTAMEVLMSEHDGVVAPYPSSQMGMAQLLQSALARQSAHAALRGIGRFALAPGPTKLAFAS